jgi:hypothetical protein
MVGKRVGRSMEVKAGAFDNNSYIYMRPVSRSPSIVCI